MSNFGKLVFFLALLLTIIVFFKSYNSHSKEGYQQINQFLFKSGDEVYDEFYANIYDYLVFNNLKDDYEVMSLVNKTNPNTESIILDVGCGTGHHVAKLAQQNLNVIGIDLSPFMINKAKELYPNYNFMVGDVMNNHQFKDNSFTHILCLYFTIYYFKDKRQFFENCMNWLMPGGYLVVHIVDREKFDPILPPGNPLYVVSPQKYAKKRITTTKITFNDFVYNSNFNMDGYNNVAKFEEKFKFNDGKVRKQEHILYMEPSDDILAIAQESGFLIQGKIDLVNCAYEYQYLYLFYKPG
jgi:ubiquinone/menaquinone biosynthesis C-methylase UbiE